MDLHTYTDLWRQQRRIHAVQDIPLPRPVPAVQLGAAAAVGLVWIPLLAGLGVPALIGAVAGYYSSGFTAAAFAGPPVAVAYLMGRPLRHHLTAAQLAYSAGRYLLSPPRLHRLGEARESPRVHMRARMWLARPPDGPPPPLRPRLPVGAGVARAVLAPVTARCTWRS